MDDNRNKEQGHMKWSIRVRVHDWVDPVRCTMYLHIVEQYISHVHHLLSGEVVKLLDHTPCNHLVLAYDKVKLGCQDRI